MKVTPESVLKKLDAVTADKRREKARGEAVEKLDIRPHIASVYHGLHEDVSSGRYMFVNLPGGRGSGKSSYISLEIVNQIMKDTTGLSNCLIVRKWAVTLRGSVFNQIQWAIDTLGVSDRWESTLTPMEFKYETGQVIRFSGLDDPGKLKSLKPTRGYFRFLWLEEFSEISGEMELRNLQQSALRGGDVFTVFRSFNPPISSANWANQYITRQDDRAITLRTTYHDIPVEWLGTAFIEEAERLKLINEKAYQNEYEGLAVGNGSEVFPNLEIREISDEEYQRQEYVYPGIDFGFAADPAVFLRVSYDRKRDTILFLDEIYKRGLSNRGLYELIVDQDLNRWGNTPGYVSPLFGSSYSSSQLLIICDCAEPKSISDLGGLGLRVSPCHKEPGCVEYRVKWLQHRKIVIDPKRTPNAAREFQNYCYETDRKTGEIRSSLPDKDNHTIDAAAYCLDRMIYRNAVTA